MAKLFWVTGKVEGLADGENVRTRFLLQVPLFLLVFLLQQSDEHLLVKWGCKYHHLEIAGVVQSRGVPVKEIKE